MMRVLLFPLLALVLAIAGVAPARAVGPLETQSIPNCPDSGGNHLNWSAGTVTMSCGTSGPSVTAIGAWDVWANATGGSADPTGVSLTAIIEGLAGSSAQGSLVYLNATQVTLLPPGTLNFPLVSGGSGANPSYKCFYHREGWGWSSNDTVVAGTFPVDSYMPYANATLVAVENRIATGGFTAVVNDNGSAVSGTCGSGVSVGSSATSTSCGGVALSVGDYLDVAVSGPSGSPNQGAVILVICAGVQ